MVSVCCSYLEKGGQNADKVSCLSSLQPACTVPLSELTVRVGGCRSGCNSSVYQITDACDVSRSLMHAMRFLQGAKERIRCYG